MPTAPRRRSRLVAIALLTLASVTLLTAVPVFAQEVPGGDALRALMIPIYAALIVGYLYFAVALQVIAKKVNAENGWWAWIPILQVVLTLKIAKKPVWWLFLLVLITVVGFVRGLPTWMSIAEVLLSLMIWIVIWMSIAKAVNKPSWWGILLIVPVVNLIVPGYLAWSD